MTSASAHDPLPDATQLFVANFHDVSFEDLPAQVITITKDQVLDFFGVALGGCREAGVSQIRDLALEWGGAPQSTVLAFGDRLPAPNAAQINATMAHSLDFDDVHEDAIMHPGVVAIPTALAMAEYVGSPGAGAASRPADRPVSGREFIAAIAVGTDFICRLGLATRPGESIHQYGWHLTTLFGYMTTAGIAARLLGLDESGITNAIGIGYHQSSGNGQCVKDGALTKRMGPGMAVRGGIASALLAQRGLTGARNCLEGAAGMYNVYHGHSYSRERLVGDLGKRFESVNVSIKPYPCCRGVHPSIDAALALVDEYDFRPEHVESIVIYCGEATYGLLGAPLEVKARPRNFVDAQFSLAWGVATAIARRRAIVDDFTPEAIKSPDVLAIAARIDVRNDPALDRGDQGMEPARVEITMKDGRILEHQVDLPTGTPERPLSFSDIERKFRGCLAHADWPISSEKADRLVQTVARLEELEDVRELIGLAT
jgi:2-methylcitrate dehydratase PrpD